MRAGSFAWLVLVMSCAGEAPVREQWLVTLRTDAPVPLVGDRLLVEIVDDEGALACDACRRLLDASKASEWPISFGIAAPQTRSALRIKARLYRARGTAPDGTPDPRGSIDVLAALPEALGPVHLELRAACLGLPATLSSSCDPATGELAPIANAPAGHGDDTLAPGSWSESTSPPCVSPAPDGMACVQGGLFFFGSFDGDDSKREQLVRVASFFADRDELSVGRARALIRARVVRGAPQIRAKDTSASSVCTYLGDTDPASDALPLNCVDRDLAEALCKAEDKRLLSEAEFAFAAANGARGSHYSWGDDLAVCAHAVVSRGATLFELDIPDLSTECRSQPGGTLPFGPVGSGPSRDETVETGALRHLGGNLAEWVQDTFASLADPCWNRRPVLVDPVCLGGPMHALRGGAWRFETWTASATFRVGSSGDGSNAIGLRCAKNAR